MSMSTPATFGGQSTASRPRDDRRLNRNDRLVLDCLRRSDGPLKAYDLLEALRTQGVNAPMTVYRALSRLTAMGSVKKIESLNAFCALPETGSDAVCAFVICDMCGAIRTRAIERDALLDLVGGDVTDASIELRTRRCFGDC